IILKKEKTLGLNGSISTSIGVPLNSSATGNINLRTDKFNIFNTTGIYYRNAPGKAYFNNHYFPRIYVDDSGQTVTMDPSFERIIEDREYTRERQGFNTNLGMEYFLTESSSLTGSVFYRSSDSNDETDNNTISFRDNQMVEQSLRSEVEEEENSTLQFALNYENRFNDKGHKLTADFQYENSKENELALIKDQRTLPNFEILPSEMIHTDETEKEYLAQL